jgi:hypothetical protein
MLERTLTRYGATAFASTTKNQDLKATNAILAPFSGLEADVHGLESMAFLAITAFERMIDSVPVPATPEVGSALWAAIHLYELIKKFQEDYVAALTEAAKAAEGDRVRS